MGIKFVILCMISIILGCSKGGTDMKIYSEPLNTKINKATHNNLPYQSKSIGFLVENYQDLPQLESQIDSFACSMLDSVAYYNDYYITILNKSTKTNFDNLKTAPKDLDRYSLLHDMLFTYTWTNGKFLIKEKYNLSQYPSSKSEVSPCVSTH